MVITAGGVAVPDQIDDREFGAAYVLRQVSEDVRGIRADLAAFATKAEVALIAAKIEEFMPKKEIDGKFKERDDRTGGRFTEIQASLKDLSDRFPSKSEFLSLKDRLDQGPIAQWLLPTIATLLSIGTALFSFATRNGTH